MKFIDKEHREFFKEKYNFLQGYRKTDVYFLSLIYLLGIDENTRNNFNKIFDIDKGEINIETLHCPWQTSSSEKVTRLAFEFASRIVLSSDNPVRSVMGSVVSIVLLFSLCIPLFPVVSPIFSPLLFHSLSILRTSLDIPLVDIS